VAELMQVLAADGSGWLNLLPGIEEGEDFASSTPGPFAIFGDRQPPVTMCTWVPPQPGRQSAEEVTIGIMHPQGRAALPLLTQAGIDVPPGWRVTQDHPRRGLVAHVALMIPHADVVAWLVRAGAALCPATLTGMWQVEAYRLV